MSGELDPVVQWCYDLGTVETVLMRTCETEEEKAAVKRVLGIDKQEQHASDAFTPDRAPRPESRPQIDHAARAATTVARYQAWVDSYPDTDPTPLRDRERTLRLARLDLQRLEGGS